MVIYLIKSNLNRIINWYLSSPQQNILFPSITAIFQYITCIKRVKYIFKMIYLMYFTVLGKSCDLTQWTEQIA